MTKCLKGKNNRIYELIYLNNIFVCILKVSINHKKTKDSKYFYLVLTALRCKLTMNFEISDFILCIKLTLVLYGLALIPSTCLFNNVLFLIIKLAHSDDTKQIKKKHTVSQLNILFSLPSSFLV